MTDADFSGETWVEIKELENLGTFGDTATEVSFDAINSQRTRRFKGTRSAGNLELVCGIDYADAGQLALIAAEATIHDYAFRVVFNDAPAGGTPSERLFAAKVASVAEALDTANNVMKLNSQLWINSNVVRVDALVKQLVTVTRQAFEEGAIASKFGLEGPLRQSLRAELCLQSWRWKDADDMARELLAETYKLLRAERPSWHEGQREWTLEAGTLIERTRCARCHKPLPEGHHKFCGPTCATTYHSRLSRIRDGDERDAIRIATRVLT